MIWLYSAATLLISYLIGSIPFGAIITQAAGLGDVRAIGSGNIGATNVLRTGRKELAAATLLLDGGKGAACVLIAHAAGAPLGLELGPMAGLAALVGHIYSLWIGFRGGKGVATLLGVMLALVWPAGLICVGIWLSATALTKISSVGGMAAAAAAPVAVLLIDRIDLLPVVLAMALLVLRKHRENIARLRAGTEPRVGQRG